MNPYNNIFKNTVQLLDYSFWCLPDSNREVLFHNIKRIDLKELYATIYLNLYDRGLITKENEPHIYSIIGLIKEWKENKQNLSEQDKIHIRTQINSAFLKLKNKYLIHQVLNNLYSVLNTPNIIYIDTDVIYLHDVNEHLINHFNGVYDIYPSELVITNLDYLYIIRHKLIAEKSNSIVKTNLDRLVIHRQNMTVKSKIMKDNEDLRETFNTLMRDDKLDRILQYD